jgi:hypothetical protein
MLCTLHTNIKIQPEKNEHRKKGVNRKNKNELPTPIKIWQALTTLQTKAFKTGTLLPAAVNR